MKIRKKFLRFAYKLFELEPSIFDGLKKIDRFFNKSIIYKRIDKYLISAQGEINVLQIGSNDGLLNDPLREFIVNREFNKVIFVEPIPYLYEKLKKNYRKVKGCNLIFKKGAVLDNRERIKIYSIKMSELSKYSADAAQIASFDRNHLIKICNENSQVENDIEEIEVECFSIASLISEIGGKLQILQIDIEGGEYYLLKEFPFHSCKPEIIIYESEHLKKSESAYLDALFKSNGYILYMDKFDTIAELIK